MRLYDRCVEVLGDRPAGVPFTPEDVALINPYLGASERPSGPLALSPASQAHLPILSRNALPTRWSPRTSDSYPELPSEQRLYAVHRLSARDRPPLNYVKLHDSPSTWASSAFPGAASSLHNHPGMTVLSKLLYGSMRVRSFDWSTPRPTRLQEPPGRPEIGPCGGQP